MIDKPSVLDEAQMRQEFRRLYREIGMTGCLQALYEMLACARILSDIMSEEAGELTKDDKPPKP